MILKYLVPVKLSLGIIPKDELLRNYNLHEVTTFLLFYKIFFESMSKLISHLLSDIISLLILFLYVSSTQRLCKL